MRLTSARLTSVGFAASTVAVGVVMVGCGAIGSQDPGPEFGTLGDEATATILAEERAELAAMLGIVDPPSVDPVRLITPEERTHTQVACMDELGYAAKVHDDGEGVVYPEVRTEAEGRNLVVAIYTCDSMYPISPRYTQPYTDRQLEYLYTHFVDKVLPCLTAIGYEPAPAPSRAVFLESEGAWFPYDSLGLMGTEYREAADTCPPLPGSDEIEEHR